MGIPLFRSGVAATHHKRAVRSELFRGGSRQFVNPGRPAECGPIAGPARAGEDRRGPAGMSRLSRSLVRNDACGRALSAAKLQGPAAAQVLFPPQIPGSVVSAIGKVTRSGRRLRVLGAKRGKERVQRAGESFRKSGRGRYLPVPSPRATRQIREG